MHLQRVQVTPVRWAFHTLLCFWSQSSGVPVHGPDIKIQKPVHFILFSLSSGRKIMLPDSILVRRQTNQTWNKKPRKPVVCAQSSSTKYLRHASSWYKYSSIDHWWCSILDHDFPARVSHLSTEYEDHNYFDCCCHFLCRRTGGNRCEEWLGQFNNCSVSYWIAMYLQVLCFKYY